MHISRLHALLNRVFLLTILLSSTLLAQAPVAFVSGTVTDPSGAIIPQADITLNDNNHPTLTAKTDAQGTYKFAGVPPGIYTLTAVADNFAGFHKDGLRVAPGHSVTLNISLKIEVQEQQITRFRRCHRFQPRQKWRRNHHEGQRP
jgi:hypothetical protein